MLSNLRRISRHVEMYFLKTVLLLILIDSSIKARDVNEDSLQKITTKARELQQEVKNAFKTFNKTCEANDNSTMNKTEFNKLVNDMLTQNFDPHGSDENQQNHVMNNDENVSKSLKEEPKSLLEKLKHKFLNIFRRENSSLQLDARFKRCLRSDFRSIDLSKAMITAEEGFAANLISSEVDELNSFLTSFIKCLGNERLIDKPEKLRESLTINVTGERPDDEISNNTRQVNFVKYLSQLQHSVQDIGKPAHKSPDLRKIQTIVDQVKNFDFFKLDEDGMESTTKVTDVSILSIDCDVEKRSSRNVIDDLSSKVKNVFGSSRKIQSSKRYDTETKQKRKSGGLFDNLNFKPYEAPRPFTVSDRDGSSEEKLKETKIKQPSEDEKLSSDLSNFQTHLSVDQQLDISQFLDHIRDKPKPFKFDTTPYLQAQMEKLNREATDEAVPQDDELLGPKKFFDFDSSPVKRSVYNSQLEDYQKIAKLKSKLVAEYRQHHPLVDYSEILRQVETKNSHKAEQTDRFLDHYYKLNDGSSNLDDFLKPYHPEHQVMSPYELNLNFQLENEYKELEPSDQNQDQRKSEAVQDDVPLFKPEIHSNAEVDDYSP